jgi:hypothetical protein
LVSCPYAPSQLTQRVQNSTFVVCMILGFELRVYTLSHSTSLFSDGFLFEIGSQELFARIDFEL